MWLDDRHARVWLWRSALRFDARPAPEQRPKPTLLLLSENFDTPIHRHNSYRVDDVADPFPSGMTSLTRYRSIIRTIMRLNWDLHMRGRNYSPVRNLLQSHRSNFYHPALESGRPMSRSERRRARHIYGAVRPICSLAQ